jgi:hypothetical protein
MDAIGPPHNPLAPRTPNTQGESPSAPPPLAARGSWLLALFRVSAVAVPAAVRPPPAARRPLPAARRPLPAARCRTIMAAHRAAS